MLRSALLTTRSTEYSLLQEKRINTLEELENIMKSELRISYTSIISQDMCPLWNSIKQYKCILLWNVNNMWIKFLSQKKNSSEWCVIKILYNFSKSKLCYVSPRNQLLPYNLSKSAPLTDNQYVQAVCYQDMFFLVILNLENGTNWLAQNIGMELPVYAAYNPRIEQVSKHAQFQCVFPTGECQMIQYKWVLWLNNSKHCLVG